MAGNDDVDLPDLSHDAKDESAPALLTGENNAEVDVKRSAQDLEAVFDVPVTVSAVLGKSAMQVSQLLKLGRAPSSNSTARSAKPSTSMSTTGWSRAAKS